MLIVYNIIYIMSKILQLTPKDFFERHPVFRYEAFKSFMQERGVHREASIRQLLRYYHHKGKLIHIRRLLYAVTPMLTQGGIDSYLVAASATQDAILGYHTALEIHNLAYTHFNELVYLTETPGYGFDFQHQHYRPICHSKILINTHQTQHDVVIIERQGIKIKVTDLERTVVDVLDRPDLSGGLEEVIRSLDHLVNFNAQKIIDYALLLNKASLAAKVGYFLEQLPKHLAVSEEILNLLLPHIPKNPYYIESSQKGEGKGEYIAKWKLIVPTYIIKRAWEEPHVDEF